MINQASELKWFCEKQEDYLLLLFSLPNSFPIRMKQKKKYCLNLSTRKIIISYFWAHPRFIIQSSVDAGQIVVRRAYGCFILASLLLF